MKQIANSNRNMTKSKFIIANITWNDSHWRDIYVNPKAGAKPVRTYPGHESLNFDFNKKGLDKGNHVFGYARWQGCPRRFVEPGFIFFFTKNLEKNRNEIVGVYGDAEILDPQEKEWEGFEDNKLISNIKAVKEKSILFPIYLDARRYRELNPEWKRLVPQSGLRYIQQDLASAIIGDAIALLKESGARRGESDKLYSIFEMIAGKKHPDKYDDDQEQSELEGIERDKSKDEIIKELKNLGPKTQELIKVNGKTYRRDNKTIAQLKRVRDHKCQICEITIQKKNGSLYIEAAHIKMKSEKGPETPDNILILCPNHHKEFDYGDKKIMAYSKKRIIFKMNGKKYTVNLEL